MTTISKSGHPSANLGLNLQLFSFVEAFIGPPSCKFTVTRYETRTAIQNYVRLPRPPEGQRIVEESAVLVSTFAIVAQVPCSTPGIKSTIDVL